LVIAKKGTFVAKYSESDKKAYLKYKKKKGNSADKFGVWLRKRSVRNASAYGDTLQKVYEMTDKSKRNRGKMESSKKERP
jgi:hypothetical protein